MSSPVNDHDTVLSTGQAATFRVQAGHHLELVLLDRPQVLDLLAFGPGAGERFSAAQTRMRQGVRVGVGSVLYSNSPHENALLQVVRDDLATRDAGEWTGTADEDRGDVAYTNHDILFPPCSAPYRARRYGIETPGCFEALAGALEGVGLGAADVHDPFNLFMSTGIASDGSLVFAKPRAVSGDVLTLRAEVDCLVALSVCPSASSGGGEGAVRVAVSESPEAAL